MTDSIDNIRAFIATVQTGSFLQAGRSMGLAPPVINKRVTHLKAHLKANLFIRTTRLLHLTEVGEKCVEPLRQIVRAYDEVLAGAKLAPGKIEGQIRLKAPSSATLLDLAGVLGAFQRAHPHVLLNMVLADGTINPLEQNFDIAVSIFAGSFEDVVEEPLYALELAPCSTPSYLAQRGEPKNLRELIDHDLVVFCSIGRSMTFEGPNGVEVVPIRPRLVSNSVQFQQDCICAGNGIAVVSRTQAEAELARGNLVEILPEYHVSPLWLRALVPADRLKLRRVQILLVFLKSASPG